METKPMASNESVVAELRKLTAKWRAKADLWNADPEYREMFRPVSEVAHANVNQCADELEPIIARLEAPPNHDTEENLADYLLRTGPPDWNYEKILRLAKQVAKGRS